jgi:4'-phosphopantetheinyl transferase
VETGIDLWLESVAVGDGDYGGYERLLDDGERNKASRFLRAADRRRYVAAHGKLRLILATYVGILPQEIVFGMEAWGKPIIENHQGSGIKFNMSHSGDSLLVAVGRVDGIGVDIEVWNEAVDCEAVLGLCFAESERYFWQTLPNVEKRAFFYRQWTRKESFVKAVGMGLGLGVAQVIAAPNGPSRFLSLPRGYGLPEDWCLLDLELASGLSGALTFPGRYPPKITYKRLG